MTMRLLLTAAAAIAGCAAGLVLFMPSAPAPAAAPGSSYAPVPVIGEDGRLTFDVSFHGLDSLFRGGIPGGPDKGGVVTDDAGFGVALTGVGPAVRDAIMADLVTLGAYLAVAPVDREIKQMVLFEHDFEEDGAMPDDGIGEVREMRRFGPVSAEGRLVVSTDGDAQRIDDATLTMSWPADEDVFLNAADLRALAATLCASDLYAVLDGGCPDEADAVRLTVRPVEATGMLARIGLRSGDAATLSRLVLVPNLRPTGSETEAGPAVTATAAPD